MRVDRATSRQLALRRAANKHGKQLYLYRGCIMHVWTYTHVLGDVTLREAGRRDAGLVSLDEGEVTVDRIHLECVIKCRDQGRLG